MYIYNSTSQRPSLNSQYLLLGVHYIPSPQTLEFSTRCGGNQDLRVNGAIVMSRHKTIDQIPQETMDRFKANVAARGYDPDDFCTFDNTDCDECTN